MSYLKNKLVGFRFKGQSVPDYMQEGLLAYLESGREPGHFLIAVLSNDLFGAYERADEENSDSIGAYVSFLYNYADSRSWGSKEKVVSWLDSKNKTRQSTTTSATGETSNGKQERQEQGGDH